MSNILIAILAYLIDKKFGEFTFMVHPLSHVREMTSYFEESYFKDTFLRGLAHLTFVIGIVSFFIICITLFLLQTPLVVNVLASSLIAAMFLSNATATKALKELFKKEHKKQTFSSLAKRDTNVKNLNDAVIAPLLYLLLLGLPGIVIYKSINVLAQELNSKERDNKLYAKSARALNDGLNFLPSYFIATVIILLDKRKTKLTNQG